MAMEWVYCTYSDAGMLINLNVLSILRAAVLTYQLLCIRYGYELRNHGNVCNEYDHIISHPPAHKHTHFFCHFQLL
jgi:hypothetical protein